MKTLRKDSKKNILVLPQGLTSEKAATALMRHGDLAIFYKCLKDGLVGVEFYTNTPCFVYIESGREVITTVDNKTHDLSANTILFLSQGQHLHSDFIRSKHLLKAYMVFFR